METLGYIYTIILYALKKKISVEDALEMIREKILEQDKETKQGQITSQKKYEGDLVHK